MRLVQAPSARYSMMPEAMLPAIPSALNHCVSSNCSAELTPAVARRHAQAGDIHEHGVAHARHGDRKDWRHAAKGRCKLFRDGEFRESQCCSRWRLYSASILLARATAVQCAISSAMYLPNCVGVIGITLSDSAVKVSRSSGDARTLLISSLSFLVMASGSFAGPTIPYQVRPLKPS